MTLIIPRYVVTIRKLDEALSPMMQDMVVFSTMIPLIDDPVFEGDAVTVSTSERVDQIKRIALGTLTVAETENETDGEVNEAV